MAEERLEIVYELLQKAQKPTGEGLFILKNKEGEMILNLDQRQMLLYAQEISKELFPNTNERYALLPIQRAYESTDEVLKEIMDDDYILINRELIIKPSTQELYDLSIDGSSKNGKIVLDPHAAVKGDDIIYVLDNVQLSEDGELGGGLISAEIHEANVPETLKRARALDVSAEVRTGEIPLQRGVYAVCCFKYGSLDSQTKKFYAHTISCSYPNITTMFPTVAVFEKVSDRHY